MAIVYIVKTGIQWDMLPDIYPKSSTVYYHFRKWTESGNLKYFLRKLIKLKRSRRGRKSSPSVVVIDSQSVRSAYAPSVKGVDGFKRVKGIKRQIAVDADGLPLCIEVTTANVHDSQGANLLIKDLHELYPTISLVKADKGYRGTIAPKEVVLECVKYNFGTSDFVPLSGRWVVERTFSWMDGYRRLSRNYEKYLSTAQAMTYFAFILMVIKC